MDEADLLGFWSHEMLYLSSMQDHWLYFGQRGEGAYAYLRPGTFRGAVFTRRLDDARLATRTVRQFSGDLRGELRRGDGHPFDVRGVHFSLTNRFAFQLQRPTRVLDLRHAVHRRGASPPAMNDYAYTRPGCPSPFEGQIRRAHAHFDPRGVLRGLGQAGDRASHAAPHPCGL